MARPLLNLSKPIKILQFQSQPIMAFLFAVMAIFSLLSIISSLCASHRTKRSHTEIEEETSTTRTSTTCRSEKKLLKKLNSSISSKTHHLMVKMISWKKVGDDQSNHEDEDYDDDEDEEALWKRTIIMGERCRPLEFSGKVLYDSDGNLLPTD